MVEALLILACLMMVLAVVMGLFGFSYQKGLAAQKQQRAQTLAQNVAEQFAANPQAGVDGLLDDSRDGLTVQVAVTGEDRTAGRLLEATITVICDDEVLATLDTARYVPDSAASNATGRQVGVDGPDETRGAHGRAEPAGDGHCPQLGCAGRPVPGHGPGRAGAGRAGAAERAGSV